jgi:cytochrome c553
MLGIENDSAIFIVLTVLLFMFLGVAILVVVDHKAQIPGEFHSDPFSIKGLRRREHPFISFLTMTILFAIIAILLFELTVTLGEKFGLFVEKEAPKLMQELKIQRVTERNRHFHNEPVEDLVNLGKKAVCLSCHGDFPHSKEPMIRTLMNMHTQFIGCLTCHNDPKKIKEESLSFAWLNFSGIEVTGKPFGVDVEPSTGYLQETDDYYSKIVAYSETENGRQLLEISETDPRAQEYLAIKDQLSDSDTEAVKKLFHKLASPRGRECSRCHTAESESYLPFRNLGFTEKRIDDLTNMNMVGIVEKYKNFYLPNLFGDNLSLPRTKPVKSDGKESVADDDPSAWWKRNFDSGDEEQ